MDTGAGHWTDAAGGAGDGSCGELEGLLPAIGSGEADALARLAAATMPRLYGLALRIVRREALAEEIVQDVYLQVWRQAGRFDLRRGPVIAWLVTMCRSRALDTLRRLEVAGRAAADADPEDEDRPAAAPDLLDAAQRHSALHCALQSLEADQRQMIALAYFRDLTQQDIARSLGLPLGTVKSRMRRALQRLREHAALAGAG